MVINEGSDASFKKIFSHNTAGGLFSSQEDALNKNPDDPNANLFSILDQLENYKNAEGNFHLKLCYPEVSGEDGSHCNEWVQTSNPVTDTTITGFRAISLAFNLDSYNNPWVGLGRSPSGHPTLMDDAPSRTYWWSAIGATRYHGGSDTIPGANPHVVKKVELHVHTGKVFH